jgi:CheY-like chemotaxis protein
MTLCQILIIDDDTDDVEILSEAFTKSGVDRVHYVNSAMRAFTYLEQVERKEDLPQLIVTDLYLPGISGSEFLTDLKNMERYKHIPVIVLSTIKSEKQIEKYKKMGVKEYLKKPTTYEEYLEVARK